MSDHSPSPAAPGPAADTTVVHLLRHGEVENPRGLIYGRLPGFHLSEDGRMMAKAAADYLAERDIVGVFTSPLERARETAEPVAERFSLEPVVDERLIEPWNHFEGLVFGIGDGSLRRLEHWWYLRICSPRPGVNTTGRSCSGCSPRWPTPRTPPVVTRSSASATSFRSG